MTRTHCGGGVLCGLLAKLGQRLGNARNAVPAKLKVVEQPRPYHVEVGIVEPGNHSPSIADRLSSSSVPASREDFVVAADGRNHAVRTASA